MLPAPVQALYAHHGFALGSYTFKFSAHYDDSNKKHHYLWCPKITLYPYPWQQRAQFLSLSLQLDQQINHLIPIKLNYHLFI